MIIAGLGNPGKEYEFTRHNAGFWAVDFLAHKLRAELRGDKYNSQTGEFSYKGNTHLLVKPLTFMNLSGDAVAPLMRRENVTPKELLVIVDDISLPIGRVRLRQSGSDGGHNGLKSIISHIGEGFWRLRIGVGQPANAEFTAHRQLVAHVLGEISDAEGAIFAKVLEDLPKLVRMWLMGMGSKAMSQFNPLNYDPSAIPPAPKPEKPEKPEPPESPAKLEKPEPLANSAPSPVTAP